MNFTGKEKELFKNKWTVGIAAAQTVRQEQGILALVSWIYWLDQYTKQVIKTQRINLDVEIDRAKESCETVKDIKRIYQKAQIYERNKAG